MKAAKHISCNIEIFLLFLECEEYSRLTRKKIVVNTLLARPAEHEIESSECVQGISLITGGQKADSNEFPHMV